MKRRQKLKIVADILMTAALLLLMPFEMVGGAAHEWIGIGMFVLFVLHHILNRKWTGNIGKGKYSHFRIVQTVLAILILLCMAGSMASGIILSRHVFVFLHIRGLSSMARTVHMFCAYWGFVLMSLHLGLHWGIMTGLAGKMFGKPSAARRQAVQLAGLAAAAYGIYAFIKRGLPGYMFLQVHFVFFDYAEPLIFFVLDYMAVMGFFVFAGHYLRKGLTRRAGGKNGRNLRPLFTLGFALNNKWKISRSSFTGYTEHVAGEKQIRDKKF